MQLAPGPIPELSAVLPPAFAAEAPGFGDFTRQALSELPELESSIDLDGSTLAQFVATSPAESIAGILSTADIELPQHTISSYLGDQNNIALASTNADELVSNAWDETPAEAFMAVPDAQNVPGTPAGVPQPGTGAHVFQNLTRPGDMNWRVGDQFSWAFHLSPGVGGGALISNLPLTMYVYDEFNGGLAKTVPLGSTDSNGFVTFMGVFDDSWLGRWGVNVQTPGGLGQSLVDQFHFIVNAATGPISQTPHHIGASLFNITNPGANDFNVGDQWRLTVTGPPNVDVLVGGTFNGGFLIDVKIGVTDENGTFQLEGSMGQANIGAWVETYIVGGVEWQDALRFTVSA